MVEPRSEEWTIVIQHHEGYLKRLVMHFAVTRPNEDLLLQYYDEISIFVHLYT